MTALFYFFAFVMLAGGLGVVLTRSPVTSAFSMVVSFLGLAALFIMLHAYLIGTLQILVYAGAIMVLFLFIIMLLDLKAEEDRKISLFTVIGGALLVSVFASQIIKVVKALPAAAEAMPELSASASEDVKNTGLLMFTDYVFPLQIIGVLLLVATVGVIVLSKKELK